MSWPARVSGIGTLVRCRADSGLAGAWFNPVLDADDCRPSEHVSAAGNYWFARRPSEEQRPAFVS